MPSTIQIKSKEFAYLIIDLVKELRSNHEYILSNQILRSGTSIGANIHEGSVAQSKREFNAKLNISLKEAVETEYWLDLIKHYNIIEDYKLPYIQINEIIRILTAIIKTTNTNLDLEKKNKK